MNELAPSQTVELDRLGRRFGDPLQSFEERRSLEPAPEIGTIFLDDIKASSAIMALPDNPTRDQIIAAYGSDIKALALRRKEADDFMLQILTCAMDRHHLDLEKQIKEDEMFESLLRPLGIAPQIALTAERSAMEPSALAKWLKEEFLADISNIARRIAVSLHYLADYNVIGLVEWMAVDVCKFHYFTWNAEHTAKTKKELSGDVMGWHTITNTATKTTTLSRTRHTHHVVNAAMHLAKSYSRPVPRRIKELVNDAPVWLRPLLIVIDGTETLYERVTQEAGQSVRVSVESVHRYDPALALGPFVLTGWNDEDLQAQDTIRDPDKSTFNFAKWSVLGSLLIAALVGLIGLVIYNDKIQSEKNYREYLAGDVASKRTVVGGVDKFTVKAGQIMKLPNDFPLTFVGLGAANDHVRFVAFAGMEYLGNAGVRQWRDTQMAHFIDGIYYGNIDLQIAFNLPYILHVHSLRAKEIVYTVESAQIQP